MKIKFWIPVALLAGLSLAGCRRVGLDVHVPAILVVNGGSHSISYLDLETRELIDVLTLEDARFPHHIYLSPDKTRFAVSITDTDLSSGHVHGSEPGKDYKVLVFEARSGRLIQSIPLQGMPHNAVFSPDGASLWVGEAGETISKVRIYDARSFELKHTIEVGAGLSELTFSTDGSRLYAANTMDNTISIIDPATKSVLRTLAVGRAPVGAWPAPNGKMYVDNESDYSISEIDVAGDSVSATFSLGSKPGYVAYHASRHEVWVSDAKNGKVVWFTQEAGNWARAGELATGTDAHAIAFSPDSSLAFVTNQGADNVSVIDVATHSKLQDIPVELKPNGIVILQ